jgi:hypothetical protein
VITHPEASSRNSAFFSRVRDLARSVTGVGLVYICPMFREVIPMRVHELNEPNLLAATPTLDLILTINRHVR